MPDATACDRISDSIREFDFVLIVLHFSALPDHIDRMTASFTRSPLKKRICCILRQPLDLVLSQIRHASKTKPSGHGALGVIEPTIKTEEHGF
jgi:hypothetical protein